ncbi:MAG: YwaF family protein [Clostridia bacterium]|nr:YwaF family protein [Clostridia bacterium]
MFDELFGEKLWGTFGTAHAIAGIIAVLSIVVLYFAIRKKTRSQQIVTLFFLSLLGLISLAFNLFTADVPYEALPLNWWAINAILLPFAILLRWKRLCNLLLLWSASSLIRIAFLDISGVEWFTAFNILAFITDVIGAGFVILLFELNLVKRDQKLLKSTLFISSVVYFCVCITNIILETNYMLSVQPVNNALLAFLYSMFSVEHWYMLLAIPFAALYMFFWYLPEYLDERKKNKNLKRKLKDLDEYFEEYEEEYIEEIIEEKYD